MIAHESIIPRYGASDPRYTGLRMTADEYLALSDDGYRYELIDGVVVLSPRPIPEHQDILAEVVFQLRAFARKHDVGRAFPEVDVRVGPTLVYTPDLVFIPGTRRVRPPRRIDSPPSMVLEILSPSTQARDLSTKLRDYEAFGIMEYWVIDPVGRRFAAYRLEGGKYLEIPVTGNEFPSVAVPGFTLDLEALRAVMWGE